MAPGEPAVPAVPDGGVALERAVAEPIRPDLLALFDKEELAKYLAEEELSA